MRRRIIQPADLSGSALAELKDWLGISRPDEDALLIALLKTCLEMCEAFTGQAPLRHRVEERVPALAGCYPLSSRPVEAVVSVEIVSEDNSRTMLGPDEYGLDRQTSGKANFRLHSHHKGQTIAVTLDAGIAATWDELPSAIRQGIIRLAAFHYRDRDRTGGTKNGDAPPASVTALWRPWRAVRLQ